ncbi:MAG: hypothetical protein R3F53_13255 [Gammaproteobacteria bacterium]
MITAIDNLGIANTVLVDINFGGINTWPTSYSINWNSILNTNTNLHDVVQIVDGKWMIVNEGIRTEQIDYDRLIAIGDIEWMNYEITVPITVHGDESTGPLSGAAGVGLILRWTGHNR